VNPEDVVDFGRVEVNGSRFGDFSPIDGVVFFFAAEVEDVFGVEGKFKIYKTEFFLSFAVGGLLVHLTGFDVAAD